MTIISIRERGTLDPDPVVCFDGQEYPFTLKDPFAPEEEKRLEWYFERYLHFPFTDQVKAQAAGASVHTYGEQLFDAVFADRDAYAVYRDATQGNLSDLTVEIAGSPAFQRLHWEALKDPKLSQPLALQANFVRRNLTPQPIRARLRESPTVNVLLVTARPGGARDVGYRTIARPLLDTLRQAKLRVKVDILRPGTYEALARHLEQVQEQHGSGYYHVIHFDVHGALLTYPMFETLEQQRADEILNQHTYQLPRYGRPALAPYSGVKAFLFLEHPQAATPDPVEATELANLLQVHGIPIAILNACQSAKQLGVEQETSLGSQLMAAGVQMVLAMGYSVTVSAARLLMREFYDQLFRGASLGAALRSARLQLYNDKRRRAYYNQQIDLEDWLLPVVYENRPQALRPREFTPEESAAYYAAVETRYPEPQTTYRFVGRDLDILALERHLLNRRNTLLLRGMGGAGKTTLLRHLGWWWQRTGFVDKVFYYGYDQKAWTRQQIMDDLGRKLLGEIDYLRYFQPLQPEAQQALLADKLCATRHLLILDNLESITGAELAIQHTLPPAEQQSLHRFVQALAGGQTLVLLGSRGGEEWLQPHTFDDNVYILPGLDPEAASELADLILARHNATQYRSDENLAKLIKLLDGYPLALEVVLANLARQAPGEVLGTLVSGAPGIDGGEPAASSPALDFSTPDIQKKTESIIACIAYAHSNLSAQAQQLLLCLTPFTGIIDLDRLPEYTEQLQVQPALAQLDFTQWPAVLRACADWGLLTEHPQVGNALQPQPTLPYFLRNRLRALPEIRAAIETAFRLHYDCYAGVLADKAASKDPSEKQLGLFLIGTEYENLCTGLSFSLDEHKSIFRMDLALVTYLEAAHENERYVALAQKSLAKMSNYAPEDLRGRIGLEFIGVLDSLAKGQLLLRRYTAAQQTYKEVLKLLQENQAMDPKQKPLGQAFTYHNLGAVAQVQRQWAQAEQHYQRALAIYIKFNDRYSQAATYHQLGIVAQEQGQWAQAEQHYQQALAIYIEFNDRYELAGTYHQLGRVAEEQRHWPQAEQHYQQALVIYIEFNDRYELAGTYHQLGMVAQEQRQWAQAQQHYQQALAIYIEFDDRYRQAGTYAQLGVLAQTQRHWRQADQHLEQALAIFIEFDDRYNQAKTYHQLGRVAQEQRHWRQAEQHLEQALAIFIEFNDRPNQAKAYRQLGMVAQEQRQWDKAKEYLLKDMEISLEFADEDGIAITLSTLARLWQESGDESLPGAVAPYLSVTAGQVVELFGRALEPGGEADGQRSFTTRHRHTTPAGPPAL